MTPAQAAALLRELALSLSDLPQGYALVPGGALFTENREIAAKSSAGSDVFLPLLEEWGSLMGYAVDYQRDERQVSSQVQLFRDRLGARTAWEWVPEGETQETYLIKDLSLTLDPALLALIDIVVTEVPIPIFGDDSFAKRITVSLTGAGPFFTSYIYCELRAQAHGCVSIVDPVILEDAALAELEVLAVATDRKLQQLR